MDLYFGQIESSSIIILGEEETNHLINVKRTRIGDKINITDGHGNLFIAELSNIGKKQSTFSIVSASKIPEKEFRLHIAIAPTKNIDRIEWFLEKATETGIEEISFIICRHSERKEIKPERLNRVLIAAMKQSLKTFLPKLNPPVDFKTFISQKITGQKIICTVTADESNTLNKAYSKKNDLLALIGPEGDFHEEELALATERFGFVQASLGKSRLRTETAALNVVTIFNFLNGQ